MLSEGRVITIDRPSNIRGRIEAGTLLLVGDRLVITREDCNEDMNNVSASRFGRWRYKSALTRPTIPFTKCYFDPMANVITDDGSPKTTIPVASSDNVGSALLTNLKVNPGVKTDNWTVKCVGTVDSQIDTPVLGVRNTGYTGTVGVSGNYTGTNAGQVVIRVSRHGDLSGVSPRCAIVQLTGIIQGNFDVVGDTPINIGSGLSITFGIDGEFGDWLFLNDSWIIDIVPSVVGSPVPGIGNESVVDNITTSGIYIGTSSDTYTVLVLTGGGSGIATVNIISTSGQDDVGPLTVNDGSDIPLGLRGGKIRFTGITNMREMDSWTVQCLPSSKQLSTGQQSNGYTGIVNSSGEFLSPVDDIYTIEVVTGGPVGSAIAEITTSSGEIISDLPIDSGELQLGPHGLIVEFTDSGEFAPGDSWTIDCQGKKTEWQVSGAITDDILPLAISGVMYRSDDETIEFYIVPGSINSEIDDEFRFSSFSAAIFVGLFLEPGTIGTEDMVFLLNSDKVVI